MYSCSLSKESILFDWRLHGHFQGTACHHSLCVLAQWPLCSALVSYLCALMCTNGLNTLKWLQSCWVVFFWLCEFTGWYVSATWNLSPYRLMLHPEDVQMSRFTGKNDVEFREQANDVRGERVPEREREGLYAVWVNVWAANDTAWEAPDEPSTCEAFVFSQAHTLSCLANHKGKKKYMQHTLTLYALLFCCHDFSFLNHAGWMWALNKIEDVV